MKKPKIMTIIGTRPEIIRLSEVIKELDRTMEHILVHTGQNYDYELNEIFFNELGLRKPDYFLEAAGESGVKTVAAVIAKTDDILAKEKPEAVLVLGDTNSALSVYAAKRRKIPVFHMEAGNRCFDDRVPEELNRRVVDHLSDINLVYSERAREYLLREGFSPERIIKTGSPLFEVLHVHEKQISASRILKELSLSSEQYFLASFHREENVENEEKLRSIVSALEALANEHSVPVIVSTHPRTRKRIDELNLEISESVRFLKPLGFFDYMKLQKHALCVLSDSGTISEESSIMNFPAVTMREAHERPEAMDEGVVIMTGAAKERVLQAVDLACSYKYGQERDFLLVSDYAAPNVSKKIPKLIMSYTDYVNRNVWKKYK